MLHFNWLNVATFITMSGGNKGIAGRVPGLLGSIAGAEGDGGDQAAKQLSC